MVSKRSYASQFSYESLELRQLLAADLSTATIPTATYFVEDVQQESIAREYLASQRETAELQLPGVGLNLAEVQRGLASTVTRFQQTVYGIPVADAWVTTIQDLEGDFVAVHDQSREVNFHETCGVGEEVITFEDSEQLALEFAGADEQFAPTQGELAWLTGEGNDKTTRLVWRTTVFGVRGEAGQDQDGNKQASGHGDFLTYIDAYSGEVISQENRIANFASGSGDVFYPNPYQTQGSGTGLNDKGVVLLWRVLRGGFRFNFGV